jgi:hypothetical protein
MSIITLKTGSVLFILVLALSLTGSDGIAAINSSETQDCISCHKEYNPGIYGDWLSSRHSRISPATALTKSNLKRRMSNIDVPDSLKNTSVGCYECHGLNAAAHKDNFDHFGYNINIVVSPNDCAVCHSTEVDEYKDSKKANALLNLRDNPLFETLVKTISCVKEIKAEKVLSCQSSENAKGETCYNCHGTEVTVTGMRTVLTDLDEIEVPKLTNWPNQGVGRINPDGSMGSCTACHPRHSFSIAVARQPYTCSQCHLHPDVPAYEIYKESKHGNIYMSNKQDFNWEIVPWQVGGDFKVPTCASCHNSLVSTIGGKKLLNRTHDFGSRIWIRLFGLVYSHPQTKDGATYKIMNAAEMPLPITFKQEIAADYLIDESEQIRRKSNMVKLCQACHSYTWVDGHFEQMDSTIAEADKMVFSATQIVKEAWDYGYAYPKNPFDETIEQKWIEQWLFYANSTRLASAMSGPDYGAFKNGWWNMTTNLQDIYEILKRAKKEN